MPMLVYIFIGFPWSSRSQILKELDGLDLSSNPVQSSPIQSLPCCNRIRNRHSSLFKEHCHFYSFATISRLADNYGELLTLSNPTPGGPSVFERYRRPSSNRSSHAFVDEGRERSRQLYLKWWASLYGLLLFLSRYGALYLNWSIGVDLTSDPRHAGPNRSLERNTSDDISFQQKSSDCQTEFSFRQSLHGTIQC